MVLGNECSSGYLEILVASISGNSTLRISCFLLVISAWCSQSCLLAHNDLHTEQGRRTRLLRQSKILDESISDRIGRVKFAVISSALNLFQAPKLDRNSRRTLLCHIKGCYRHPFHDARLESRKST